MTTQTRVRLFEIACVLTIVASVAAIVVPKLDDVKRRDAAATILADLEVLRDAVYQFHADSGYFPEESPIALFPETLTRYLPGGFTSRRAYGVIAYKNWPGDENRDTAVTAGIPGIAAGAEAVAGVGQPRASIPQGTTAISVSNIVGATITNADPRIVATASARSPKTVRFVVGSTFTFLFFGT